MGDSLERRAGIHRALADPVRLAIVDELIVSDRSPSELADRFGLATNLLSHHLDVLASAGVVTRLASAGDRRRRYVALNTDSLDELARPRPAPPGPVLFVCTHNSARSQLAAALWQRHTGRPAASAGTEPAERVHPGAEAAARRVGLDLTGARPRHLADVELPGTVVTVCDRAHEDLDPRPSWWHWSVADPVLAGTRVAFDTAMAHLDRRVRSLAA